MNHLEGLCLCVATPRPRWRAVLDLAEEFRELLEEPSAEELSDVCFATGRLLAALVGRVYFHLPGAGRTVAKMRRRAETTGCVRSLRHHPLGVCAELVDGRAQPEETP